MSLACVRLWDELDPGRGRGGWVRRGGPSHLLTAPSGPVPADGILSFLKSSKPGDALCVLGLTLSDLYPREAWTFTFGTFLPGHGELAPGGLPPQP